MSVYKVIDGIDALIALIDDSTKVWDGGRKNLRLSTTFETVAKRLPILRETLQTFHIHFEPAKNTLSQDAVQALIKII